MEEQEPPPVHPDYLKGFNDGYVMAKYQPDLFNQLTKNLSESEQSMGFKEGGQEYVVDLAKDKYPDWLNDSRPYDFDTPDKEPERDEPTR